jgi:hypothetical protein
MAAFGFGFVLLGELDLGLPGYFVVLPFGDTRNSYDRHAAIYGRCVVQLPIDLLWGSDQLSLSTSTRMKRNILMVASWVCLGGFICP